MKETIMYECEICSEIYRSENEALECEARGKETKLVNIGEEVSYEIEVGGGFNNIYIEARVKTIEDIGHYLIYHLEEEYEDGIWNDSMQSVFGNEEFQNKVTIK